MIRHPEGLALNVVVPFADANGAALAVTRLHASVYDGEDGLVADLAPVSWPVEATSVTLQVPASHLAVPARQMRAAYTLALSLVHADGVHEVFHDIIVEAGEGIAVMVNSFQSYAAAEMLSLETSNIAGWEGASETGRKAALSEAFRRITAIPMRYTHFDLEGIPLGEENYISRTQWLEIDRDDFITFPSAFRRALQLAQFLEANEILEGDPIADRHRAGVVSESVGESSVTLRAGRIDYGVSAQALKALAGYVHFGLRMARS